ncbi:hypothetical protein AX15_001988 [Amanita polypyramis BW_CC]|nr:hypothetical protein AX15_001988 [Amanita polypyramis BW_CC]
MSSVTDPASGPVSFDRYDHIPLSSQPPSKANLKAWWHQFTSNQKARKEIESRLKDGAYSAMHPAPSLTSSPLEHPVFGKPLQESLRYASVQISTSDSNGRLYVWGYIPVVVAKCGLYLKENATEVEGTFRINGSNKRMKDLQAAFETALRYGKDLDWKQENYTTHDVASVFRRYLTQMPEPVIPCNMYHSFRDPLAKDYYNQVEVIKTYKTLIRQMPRSNQYLLLYVLDLLSVFARKSEKNLMTATNLAVMFQPGIISHPNHELSPREHSLSQRVLEFLIVHQDWFMLDISPPTQTEKGSRSSTPRPGHNLVLVPSKDSEKGEEENGWYHVDRAAVGPPMMVRRKTTLEHRTETSHIDAAFRLETRDKPTDGDLTPVPESPKSEKSSTPGVSRSRTLPSSRSRGFSMSTVGNTAHGNTSNGHPDKGKVLRKPKRNPLYSQQSHTDWPITKDS